MRERFASVVMGDGTRGFGRRGRCSGSRLHLRGCNPDHASKIAAFEFMEEVVWLRITVWALGFSILGLRLFPQGFELGVYK